MMCLLVQQIKWKLIKKPCCTGLLAFLFLTIKEKCGGLWTNACCSHPYFNQETLSAAQKRLQEEMGFTTVLTKAFEFVYKATFNNGLTEYEYDHVFVGQYDGEIVPDKNEVEGFCFKGMDEIKNDLQLYPQQYTAWFTIAFYKMENYLKQKF
jgi:isopentenyl-diphosphate Delta-isomerase